MSIDRRRPRRHEWETLHKTGERGAHSDETPLAGGAMAQTEISAQAALLDRLRHLGAPDDLAQAHPVDIAEALNLLEPRVAGRALSSLPFSLAVRGPAQPAPHRRPATFPDPPPPTAR